MYFLIETDTQLQRFIDRDYKEVFVNLILLNNTQHIINNEVLAIYIRPVEANKGYIINLKHNDALYLDLNLTELLKNYKKVYTIDKKNLLHKVNLNSTIIDICEDDEFKSNISNYFYKDCTEIINNIIPIVKHYEENENLYNLIKDKFNNEINRFYNDKLAPLLNIIESNGLKVDKEKFEKYFHPINNDTVYTCYNYKTVTKRPYNKFNNVNYLALDKSNGCRECFIPRNDLLVEIDISSFHLVLIAKLINYDFKEENPHEHLSKIYKKSYEESKSITFKNMYGNIDSCYSDIEFFKKIKEYSISLYNEYKTNGYVKCKYSNNVFKYNKDINSNKLFNYCIQNLETTISTYIIYDLIKLFRNRKTKLVLYIFDAFLLDYSYSDNDLKDEIFNIFKKYKLSVKIKKGKNYNF